MPKPEKKMNLIHAQILGALVTPLGSNKLARNVSWENVDRAAKRWIA